MDWPSGSHASTFGGNPISCRAALATLDLLEAGLMANATQRGEQLQHGLRRLQQECPQVGEVRGLGLMVAMEMVSSQTPYTLAPALREAVVQAAFRKGLLLLGCGESAVRFCPPLCITAEQVLTTVDLLGQVLAEMPAPLRTS
jgi:4-aminobutyrate aminotransferase